jgi:hypothetical protein
MMREPTDLQLELLALVASDDDPRERWERLRLRLDLDRPEFGTYWLLPLLCERLGAAGIDDPMLPRLRGIRRKTLYLNTLRLEQLARLAAAAEAAGSRVLLGPEACALVRGYASPALRPSPYLDLVVVGDVAAVARIARDDGWIARPARAETVLEGEHGTTVALRAHAVVGLDDLDETIRAEITAAAERISVHGAELEALALADVALARCLGEPRLLALLDVAALTASGSIDCDRFAWIAEKARQTLRVSRFLADLAAVAPNESLAELCERVARAPVAARSRLELRLAELRTPWLGVLPQTLAQHLRATAAASPVRAVSRLPATLRGEWGGALVRPALQKAVRHTLGRQ